MAGFCKHCGKELKDDEPYCPECGMPTGSSYTPMPTYAPRRNGNRVAIVIVVVIIALSILMIAIIPMLIDNQPSDEYTVTIRVESVSINVEDPHYYGPMLQARLDIACTTGSSTVNHTFGVWTDVPSNGTAYTPTMDNTLKLSVSGNPKDVKYTAFLVFKNNHAPDEITYDYADLYDVTGKVTSPPTTPLYYGCSGVTFDGEDYDGLTITLKGDSDPIGCVKLSFSPVKNQ